MGGPSRQWEVLSVERRCRDAAERGSYASSLLMTTIFGSVISSIA
jgi:hypothetical protein